MGVLEWLGFRPAGRSVAGQDDGPPVGDTLVRQEARGISQLWPPIITEPRTLTRQVWDGVTAAGIPAVGKALTLYGLLGGLNLQAWRGTKLLPTPQLLLQPDPDEPGSTWFVQQNLTDWLLSGNACNLVTARDAIGRPAAVKWFPAHLWTVTQGPLGEDRRYYLAGRPVDRDDVVHVKRGHDPAAWGARGIGIVQQHLGTLDRAGMQEAAESGTLKSGGVPSVVVIAPQVDLTQDDADAAGLAWDAAFGGPVRRPGIFSKGTEVIPLSWSATDSQMVEARKMTLIDVANLTGLDSYWLGGQSSSHTYKSPGPMFLVLLRTAFEPVLSLFEDAWSSSWLARGQQVRFDRDELTRDDLQTTITTMNQATSGEQLLTYEEARVYLGRDPNVKPTPKPIPPTTDQTDQQGNQEGAAA